MCYLKSISCLIVLQVSEWMIAVQSLNEQFFIYVIVRTCYTWWDDDGVHIVLDRHDQLDLYSAISQSTGRHVTPIWLHTSREKNVKKINDERIIDTFNMMLVQKKADYIFLYFFGFFFHIKCVSFIKWLKQ